jgi:hypothetical protein
VERGETSKVWSDGRLDMTGVFGNSDRLHEVSWGNGLDTDRPPISCNVPLGVLTLLDSILALIDASRAASLAGSRPSHNGRREAGEESVE